MSTATTSGARLDQKIALVTGGAGNIGETLTRCYLAQGATVIITGRNEQKLQAYRDTLITSEQVVPEQIVAMQMDGSDVRDVRNGVAAILQVFDHIDILVNNAGSAGARQRLLNIPLTADDLQSDTETLSDSIGNLLGITWNLIRIVAPHMPPGSSIINVSTIFSRTDYYGRIPYVVPKAALNALSSQVAQELGGRGIRVNTIYPGPIDSDRIRNVFKTMDGLKGVPENTTAQGFFDIMRLSHAAADDTLAKRFPRTLDVAQAAVFLGSDESAGLSGHAIEVTNGMNVPAESKTTFVSRPGLRAVDATGRVALVCAGEQIEDAMALAGVLRSCGGDVVLGFRSRAAVAEMEHILQETRRIPGAGYVPPLILYLNPLEPESIVQALAWIEESVGTVDGAIVLPARGVDHEYPPLSEADDEWVAAFLEEELVGAVALASQLARFWQNRVMVAGAAMHAPQVLFLTNGDDGRGNVYANVLRAGVEQLVRVWRHEAALDATQTDGEQQGAALRKLPPVWANQIIRYTNNEDEGLDFACAWAAKLIHSSRQIEEINLYLPEKLSITTGARLPSFGWAENLIGLHLGKVALITGGSAGIGGQVARLLALGGARVMLAARGAAQLGQMQKLILGELAEVGYNDAAARVRIVADCDVSDETQLVALVEQTIDAFGHVDYLINNAGVSGVEEMVVDIPLDGWNRTLNANLISNFSLIRKLAPLMKAQGSGYILNVSSYFGGEKYVAIPYPNRADYAVSKAGQRAMAEGLARFLGPEIQINALAPGPVDGDRLRGTGERPGLFMRRARLILENKRLNEVHTALIESYRTTGVPMAEMVRALLNNDTQQLVERSDLPQPLQALATSIWGQSESQGSSHAYLLQPPILQKLIQRLVAGNHLDVIEADDVVLQLAVVPPEPFFARTQIEREARKVGDGIMAMLYLQRMPTEFDVAMATVYYLADRNVSGETFHPSGGLRFERTATGGELFGVAEPQRLALLAGTTALLIGEYLDEHIARLVQAYIDTYNVEQVVVITETKAAGSALLKRFHAHQADGRLHTIAAGDDLEEAIDHACRQFGRPGPVVCSPFRALPTKLLVGRTDSDWSTVLNESDFAELVERQLTHHFRIARKVTLMDDVQLVLVTPETTAQSTTEQFALANFVKTTMHAFTATLGVESSRLVHRALVNQVDLARRARAEEPRDDAEREQELARFVDAVMLASAPIPTNIDSRYGARIHRGRAITV